MDSPAPKRPLTSLILNSLCPRCETGKITEGLIGMKKVCPHCGYDLHPENGYYLGAMMVSFFAVAALTIPPVIALKLSGADDRWIIAYPFIQYLIVGPLLMHYAKVIWAHLGYHSHLRMEKELRDHYARTGQKPPEDKPQ